MSFRAWKTISIFFLACFPLEAWAGTLTLEQALSRAIAANPEIAAQASRADAEHGAIRAQYSLENPKFGLMHESNMNLMEVQMGPMNIWSVSQEIKFPTKYFLMGSAQHSRALAADQELSNTRLQIRQKVITAYYNLFSIDRVLALLEAQRETLREVARSAESRHATGSVPQQDEMKAHVEQSKIETDLLSAKEEQSVAEAALNQLMDRPSTTDLAMPQTELAYPKLTATPAEIEKIALGHSRTIQAARLSAREAHTRKALAGWNFAPDFMLFYKQAYTNSPPDSYSAGVEMSFPLWFFMKQTSEYSSASARAAAAEKRVDEVTVNTSAEVKSLISKVGNHEKLLQIYQTSLIPQATTTLSSSRGAYRAGRTNFLELLDSERSLYAVRIAYYRTLSQYVEYLTRLEQVTGASLSSLPFGDSL